MSKSEDGLDALRAAVAAAEVVAQHVTALEAAVRAGDKAASDAIWEPMRKAWDAEDEAYFAWVDTLSPADAAERWAERAALGRECKAAALAGFVNLLSPLIVQVEGRWGQRPGISPQEAGWLEEDLPRVADAWLHDRNLFTDEMQAQPLGQALAAWTALAEAKTARAMGTPEPVT